MTAPLRPQSAEPNWEEVHSLLDKWEKVWNGDKAKFTATYPQWIVDAAGELFAHDICDKWAWNDYVRAAAVIIARHAEAYARAVAAESRKHNWKCVAPENGYYRWQCQNPGCSETAPYPSVLPDSSCAYSAALPVGESPAAAPAAPLSPCEHNNTKQENPQQGKCSENFHNVLITSGAVPSDGTPVFIACDCGATEVGHSKGPKGEERVGPVKNRFIPAATLRPESK